MISLSSEFAVKRVSKSNSRKWEDLEFRRAYMKANPWCELTPMLIGIVPGLNRREAATDPHHLIGGSGRRWDVKSNLIAVCRPVHLWCHRELKDSRVLGIWIKVKSGLFDHEEFKTVSGKYLEGFLMANKPRHPAFLSIHAALVSYCERKGGE